MPKVLLVDTGFSAVPIYLELCRLGYEVHVVGRNPNDCLAKSSKYYWNIDYSNADDLESLIERESFSFIVPGCTDISYYACARVNKGRFPSIDSIDTNLAINNKARFRKIAQEIGLQVPHVLEANKTGLRWPLIVKPVDAFSGKGITVIEREDHEALACAIDKASRVSTRGEVLIEDFVAGVLYSYSAFLCNGQVLQDFIVQESSTVNPFVVDTSRVVFEPSVKLCKSLRQSIEKLAKALKLGDGLIHTQFILAVDQVWLIEITRRCPGDLYSQLIELSTGFPYVESYIRPFLGMPILKQDKLRYIHPIMRHTLTVNKKQNLGFIKFKRPILIERWVPLSLVGDELKKSPYSRVGVIFISAKNDSELNALYESTLRQDLYEIKP